MNCINFNFPVTNVITVEDYKNESYYTTVQTNEKLGNMLKIDKLKY